MTSPTAYYSRVQLTFGKQIDHLQLMELTNSGGSGPFGGGQQKDKGDGVAATASWATLSTCGLKGIAADKETDTKTRR